MNERENPVEWIVVDRKTGDSVFVERQTWHDAIRDGAIKLGTSPERCTCVRSENSEETDSQEPETKAVQKVGKPPSGAGLTRAQGEGLKGSARA